MGIQQKDYVSRRAELLAQLFLEDLGATVWTTRGDDGPFDSIAAMFTEDKKLRIIAVEVKATEKVLESHYVWHGAPNSIAALQHSNIPVLMLVVDVKHNKLYYGWASEVHCVSARSEGKQTVRCTLPIVSADEGKEELLKTILSQPDFSERARVG